MGTRNSHEKYFMLGRAEGKYGRGRPRLIWIDGLKSQIGFSLGQLIQIAINRQEWGQLVHEVSRGRCRLDGTR